MQKPTRKKVLVVDDERDLVEPLLIRLKATGLYEVAAAYDGRDGLARAAQFRPDIALIDLAMPELDGWHLCRKLRENPHTRATKVIIMTAWLSPDLGRRATSEGVTRLLLKPFEDGDLLTALELEPAAAPGESGGDAP